MSRFAIKKEQHFGHRVVVKYTGSKRPLELNFLLKGCMIRRLKNEVLTMLPDKTRIRVRADPDKIDKKAMKELRELEKGPSDGDEAAI